MAAELLDEELFKVVKKKVQTASRTKDEEGFKWGGVILKRGGVIHQNVDKGFKFAKKLDRVGLSKRIIKCARRLQS